MTTTTLNNDALLINFNIKNKKKKWESFIIKNKLWIKDRLSQNIDNELVRIKSL